MVNGIDTVDLVIKSSTEFYNVLKEDEYGRYRSWEHCYSHFMKARGQKDIDYDYLSLQLSFYLANISSKSRYNPHVFTEQGLYMLMTVLKGSLAVKQSKALIRTFKKMKDYILENRDLIGQRELLQLSIRLVKHL